MSNLQKQHWYPAAKVDQRPSHWWYWGRAVYVSRRDYARIFLAFLCVGLPLGAIGFWAKVEVLLWAMFVIAGIGWLLLVYSLFGLYRMYGHPSLRYYQRLLQQGRVQDGTIVADLHIGTYRTTFALADLLPHSTIHSIDCWDVAGPPAEPAVADVRAIEPAPVAMPRIVAAKAFNFELPLADASCDVVVFGFGTHEVPVGAAREKLFAEARRVLKHEGRVLLFEHGVDLHNFVIFGPIIEHVTRRQDWLELMQRHFAEVSYQRSSAAVDLMVGTRGAA